jgi:hypothetical protein
MFSGQQLIQKIISFERLKLWILIASRTKKNWVGKGSSELLFFSFQLLVPLVSVYRYDGPEVNTSLAHSEAKILHEKIHNKAYSDEEIIRILTTRSKAQLLATFNSYNDQFTHPINKVNNTVTNDLLLVKFAFFLQILKAHISHCSVLPMLLISWWK